MTKTVTQATIKQYQEKAQWLANRYKLESNGGDLTLEQWITQISRSITMRTWTSYRASLIWAINNNEISLIGVSKEDALIHLTNTNLLETKNKKESTNTTRLRYKYLPDNVYVRLIELMNASSSYYDKYLSLCFEATVMTGLRPSEWKTLEIQNIPKRKNTYMLKVTNGKYTNGRSFSKYRHLLLVANIRDIKIIKTVKEIATDIFKKGGETAWDKFNRSCIDRLKYLNVRIGQKNNKKRVTLYSARHQFKVNIEAQPKCTKYILAALMGHGSIATAGINYGRKSKAKKSRVKIMPHSKDVEKVKIWNRGKTHKFEINQKASVVKTMSENDE